MDSNELVNVTLEDIRVFQTSRNCRTVGLIFNSRAAGALFISEQHDLFYWRVLKRNPFYFRVYERCD